MAAKTGSPFCEPVSKGCCEAIHHHGCRNRQSGFAAGRTVRMRFCLCAAYLRSPRQKSDERGYRFARRHQETVIERKSDFAGTVQRPKERLLCVERKVSVARLKRGRV